MRTGLIYCLCLLGLMSCDESFELNAPYEDIWVVYGILNPGDTTQYIRVSKAFQVEGNAFEFARENDLTVKGLEVSLTGNGQTYLATQLDSVMRDPEEGDFSPFLTLYRFSTPADKQLVPAQVYQLTIRSPIDTSLLLQAQTRIPPEPTIVSPRLSGSGRNQCLLPIAFEDSTRIIFRRQNAISTTQARAYQISVGLAYREDGSEKHYTFGPTAPFSNNQNCNGVGANNLCYLFENGAIMNGFRGRLRNELSAYQYQSNPSCGVPAEVAKAVTIEVAAMDTFLFRYISANDPGYINLNTVRREYTNISGSAKAVGLFGSVATDKVPVALTPCGEYLLRLNGASDPGVCD